MIEVLVVADQSMVKFHGNAAVRKYVLTVMSMVRRIVRIWFLCKNLIAVSTLLTHGVGSRRGLYIVVFPHPALLKKKPNSALIGAH